MLSDQLRARAEHVVPWRRVLRRAALITLVVYAPLLVASVLAVFGVVHDFLWQLCYFALVLFAAPTAIFYWLFMLFPAARRASATVAVTLLMLLVALPLTLWLSSQLRHVGYRLAVERLQPVAAAVEQFVAERGRPPERVEDLVPAYLAGLPERVPKLHLWGVHAGQPWVLVASYYDGIGDGYDVTYLPNGSAGDRRAEPLGGNWYCVRF